MTQDTTIEGSNPSGLCMCGCGRRTALATRTCTSRGWVIGQPVRFIQNHGSRVPREKYVVDPATGCWIWQLYLDSHGYGRQRAALAHRVMYEMLVGPIPSGLTLDHLCRNPACVNPSHLEPVSNTENVRRGVSAKLKIADIPVIRSLLGSMTHRQIAERYGVVPSAISNIASGRAWKDVTP